MDGTCNMCRGTREVHVGKHEGKRQTGRPRRRWEDIRVDLKGTGRINLGWMHMARYRIGVGLL